MASEAAVIPRRKTLSIVATVKEALAFCDQQDHTSDLCEEMRKATQMIRAMSRTFQPHDLLRL
jgi:hypothetical protein